MYKYFTVVLASVFLLISCQKKRDYYNTPLYSNNGDINAVIEIPAETNKKYEFNNKTQVFEIDKKNGKERVINFLPYPGNYGYIPSTFSDPKQGGDGDALDVLVLSESVLTGSIVKIKPVAVLKLIDEGEIDFKIIAVPTDLSKQIIKVDSFNTLSENYPNILRIIELWFLNYNKDDEAKIEGWADENAALAEIKSARK